MHLDPTSGDLVLWHTPAGSLALGLVVVEECGHGGGRTGWFRVLATLRGHTATYLTRAPHVEIVSRAGATST